MDNGSKYLLIIKFQFNRLVYLKICELNDLYILYILFYKIFSVSSRIS